MKRRRFNKSMAMVLLPALLAAGSAWGAFPPPLSQVTNPVFGTPGGAIPQTVPPHLAPYIKDMNAAVKLGKALFWDMQVGSDGMTACASCHYKAGADPLNIRAKNQIHPGPNGTFDNGTSANFAIGPVTFPFLQSQDERTGSQGVLKTSFTGVILGSAVDAGTPVTDTVFTFNDHNIRQVTGRNTPPAVNAVFNYDNFWDGRGKNAFNGSSPIGPLDAGAGIWLDNGGTLTKTTIAIPNSSLASQSVGPPLSDVEMSWAGRTWPELGRKMLSLTPLGRQAVHPNDSVLGSLSKASLQGGSLSGAKGINASYVQMIQDAFVSTLWNSTATVNLDTRGAQVSFSQMEANFSLFWGLAIQVYEATLVSDQSPFDLALQADPNNPGAPMNDSAARGANQFQSQCASCHAGSEFTNASVSFAENALAAPGGTLIELDVTGTLGGISDVGFSNIGVRPSDDDLGRGAAINFPLSFAGETVASPVVPFATFLLPALATQASPVAVNGSFKVPSIRNVELTAPYMHNGSLSSLVELVNFYRAGANFPLNPELDVEMKSFGNAVDTPDMVEFLKAMTDPRVANESAPFDHPELPLPDGDPGIIILPSRGADGSAAPSIIKPSLTVAAPATPTRIAAVTLSGTVETGIVPAVSGGTTGAMSISNGTAWSCPVTLTKGINTLTVSATDPFGQASTATAQINVIFPDGCFKGTATPAIDDALKALRISVNLDVPSIEDTMHGDVSPVINGVATGGDGINISDALLILKKIVGLPSYN